MWVTDALAQKIGVVESAEEFFAHRRNQAPGRDLKYYLDMVPDVPPMPGDELPEGWISQ
jgi:hypothetical protein